MRSILISCLSELVVYFMFSLSRSTRGRADQVDFRGEGESHIMSS